MNNRGLTKTSQRFRCIPIASIIGLAVTGCNSGPAGPSAGAGATTAGSANANGPVALRGGPAPPQARYIYDHTLDSPVSLTEVDEQRGFSRYPCCESFIFGDPPHVNAVDAELVADDPDTEVSALLFHWELLTQGDAGAVVVQPGPAVITSRDTARTQIVVERGGDYHLRVTVSDGGSSYVTDFDLPVRSRRSACFTGRVTVQGQPFGEALVDAEQSASDAVLYQNLGPHIFINGGIISSDGDLAPCSRLPDQLPVIVTVTAVAE